MRPRAGVASTSAKGRGPEGSFAVKESQASPTPQNFSSILRPKPESRSGTVSRYIFHYSDERGARGGEAKWLKRLKAAVGIEPTNKGFAVKKVCSDKFC
jgi:hypothetical protein